jgi:predicted nucleic acid-binding protein
MTHYVVDASVAVKWFHEEEHSAHAVKLLTGNHRMHAPDFLYLELDSVLCRLIRHGILASAEAAETRAALQAVDISVSPFGSLQESAYEVANETRCSIYDSLYLALAISLRVPVVTADRRFFNAVSVGPVHEYILWVEDIG